MTESSDLRTLAVTAGRPERVAEAPLNTPIVAASSFVAGGQLAYAREDSPTVGALEDTLGALEGGSAVAFSSGMAAANAVLDLLPHGAIVVAPEAFYTGVAIRLRELAEGGRIQVRHVAVDDTEAVRTACMDAHLLWLESPTNPLLAVADIAASARVAHAHGALVLVDNTFATPVLQQPLAEGADVVLHSVSKALSGHSDVILGALVTRDAQLAEQYRSRRVLLGASPSAFDAFLALRGIRTLPLRIERAQQNARDITARLATHPQVACVRYPGFGTMAAIETVGDSDQAELVCERVRLWTHATSLGGVESLLERRRRWPGESDLVPENLIRLSFGIEAVEDLWADLDKALSSAPTPPATGRVRR